MDRKLCHLWQIFCFARVIAITTLLIGFYEHHVTTQIHTYPLVLSEYSSSAQFRFLEEIPVAHHYHHLEITLLRESKVCKVKGNQRVS